MLASVTLRYYKVEVLIPRCQSAAITNVGRKISKIKHLEEGVTATFTFLSFVLCLPNKILSLPKPVNVLSLKTGHVKEATRLLIEQVVKKLHWM